MQKKSENSIISCDDKYNINQDVFDTFCEKFEEEYLKIKEFFNYKSVVLIELLPKQEFDIVVKKVSASYKSIDIPDWLVGFSTKEKVYIVIPIAQNVASQYKVALHESVHLVSYSIKTESKRFKILDEGIAVYLSNQYEGKIITPWMNEYLKNELPTIKYFLTYDTLEFVEKQRLSFFVFDY